LSLENSNFEETDPLIRCLTTHFKYSLLLKSSVYHIYEKSQSLNICFTKKDPAKMRILVFIRLTI